MSIDPDRLARKLAAYGSVAARMPLGSFLHRGDAHPVFAGGKRIGRALPGIGLVLDADAKRLGLTRCPRNVYSRTPFARSAERALRADDGAITSMATLISTYAGSKQQCQRNDSTAFFGNDVGEAWFFTFDEITSGNYTNPGGTCKRTSPANAFNAQMLDPPSGMTNYLVGIHAMLNGTSVTNNGFSMACLIDVLAQAGGQDWSTSVGPFTYSTGALTRYTSGAGVYMTYVAQINNQLNCNGATTFTIGYHNQAGSTATTTYTSQSGQTYGEAPNDLNATTGSSPFVALASGDYGVRSVDSVTLSTALLNTSNGLAGILLFKIHAFYEPCTDLATTYERDVATEVDKMLIPLAVDSGGTLGYIAACYCVAGTNVQAGPSAQVVTWTMDYCQG